MAEDSDSENADDVAAKLRERVRAQAAALLDKVDMRETSSAAKKTEVDTASSLLSPTEKAAAAAGNGSGGSTPKDPPQRRESSNELTKRLQKLALERQKQNKDRLKVIQSDKNSHLSSVKNFQDLNLPKHLLDAIFAMGFDRPSAIQEEALPRILADPPRNLIGQAQSGSGKTAAFTLGMLYRIKVDTPSTTQALCVTPTRELAIQIWTKAVKPMAANMKGLKVELAISGNHIAKSVGVDAHLVVGTPGKVVDWLKRKIMNPKTIKVFVLDEADNMGTTKSQRAYLFGSRQCTHTFLTACLFVFAVDEGGFRANSKLIKQTLPRTCQCLLFSATFTEEVVRFASKMVENPDKILIEDGPEFLVRC